MCLDPGMRWLLLDIPCQSFPLLRFQVYSYASRYGSSANLVLSTGSGVNGYTLDAALGEFILTHPDV